MKYGVLHVKILRKNGKISRKKNWHSLDPLNNCLYRLQLLQTFQYFTKIYFYIFLLFYHSTEIIVLTGISLRQYCASDKIEKNEMGWACGAYGWGEGVYRVLVGKPERDHWGDLGVDGWIILGWISRRLGCGYMDRTGLAQARERCRTLVSAVMNLRVPWNAGNFLTSCKPVSFSRRTLHHGVSE